MKSVKGIYNDDSQAAVLMSLAMTKPMLGVLFYLGIVSGLRISDLLSLKGSDFDSPWITVKEGKTKKYKTFELPPEGWQYIRAYLEYQNADKDERIFSITRQTVNNAFKKVGAELD